MKKASPFYENAFLCIASVLVNYTAFEKYDYFTKLQEQCPSLADYLQFGLELIHIGAPPYYREIAMERELYQFMETNPNLEEYSIGAIIKAVIVNGSFPDMEVFQTIYSYEFNFVEFSKQTDFQMKELLCPSLHGNPKMRPSYVPTGYHLKNDFPCSLLYENDSGDTLFLKQIIMEEMAEGEQAIAGLHCVDKQPSGSISMWENQRGMLYERNDGIHLMWNQEQANEKYKFYLCAASLPLPVLLRIAKSLTQAVSKE